MKSKHSVWLLVLLALMVCGCKPKFQQYLQTCWVGQIEELSLHSEGEVLRYAVGLDVREALQAELESWQRAGFDGFALSVVTYAPDVCLTFRSVNSAPYEQPFMDLLEACSINFTERVVVVNEVRRNGSAQYVREATVADKRFRQFLLEMAARTQAQ